MKLPEIGKTLKNGATLLDSKGGENGNDIYVLALFNDEYVTWVYNVYDGSCYWGYYYGKDLVEAAKGFEERVGRANMFDNKRA